MLIGSISTEAHVIYSVMCAAIRSLAPRFVGRTLASLTENMGQTQRKLQSGQIRFMSPERGVLQLATCAVLNAVWDLWAKAAGKPLWRLVADFSPEEFVRVIDFRYLSDVLTREQALEMLVEKEKSKADRIKMALQNKAVPAYNTSAGWLGQSDEEVSNSHLFTKPFWLQTLKCPAGQETHQQGSKGGFQAFQIESRSGYRSRPQTTWSCTPNGRGRWCSHG